MRTGRYCKADFGRRSSRVIHLNNSLLTVGRVRHEVHERNSLTLDLTIVQVVESNESDPTHVGIGEGYCPCLVRAASSNLDYSEASRYGTVRTFMLKKIRVRPGATVDVRKVGAGIDAVRSQDPSVGELSESVHAIGLRLKSSLGQQGNVVGRVRVGESDVENNRSRCWHAEC